MSNAFATMDVAVPLLSELLVLLPSDYTIVGSERCPYHGVVRLLLRVPDASLDGARLSCQVEGSPGTRVVRVVPLGAV